MTGIFGTNKELRKVYALPNIITVIKLRMRWVGHVALMGLMRNTYTILVRKPEGRRLLKRPRHELEENIRVNLKETWWEGVEWMHDLEWRPVVGGLL